MPLTPDYRASQPHTPEYASDFSSNLRSGKYMFLDRPAIAPHILAYGAQPGGSVPALPTAAADQVDVLQFSGAFGNQGVELYQATAQTLMPLVHATQGIEIALDQVDNESVEYVPGGNRASNPLGYLAGTDPGVFIRATVLFTANNGTDQFVIGFRKQGAYVVPGATGWYNGQAGPYADFAALGFAAAVSNPNQIRSSTAVGAAVTVATATAFTIASGVFHTLEVRIKGRVASYFINGASLGSKISKDGLGNTITAIQTLTPPVYTFTSALQLVPFIFCRQDAVTTTVFLRRLVVGQLGEDGLASDQRVVSLG